jgi:hypothetical protein
MASSIDEVLLSLPASPLHTRTSGKLEELKSDFVAMRIRQRFGIVPE